MQSSSASAPVKAYAALLVNDHSKGLAKVKSLADELKLTPAAPAGDTSVVAVSHTMDRLKSLSSADLDTAFVNHEIADHKEDIEAAKGMKTAAKNAKVKALVESSLPELRKHLDRAEALAKKA